MLNQTLSFTPVASDSIYRLSVSQYQEMVEKGIIDDEADVELLAGIVSDKMPKNRPHTVLTNLLYQLILALLPDGWYIQMEAPIVTSNSMPEPDLSIVKGKLATSFDDHPTTSEIDLLIEVSDTTLDRDQTIKKEIYADAGIPTYWIVNLQDRQIEVYTKPLASRDYGERRTYQFDQQVPVVIDGKTIGELKLADHLAA